MKPIPIKDQNGNIVGEIIKDLGNRRYEGYIKAEYMDDGLSISTGLFNEPEADVPTIIRNPPCNPSNN